MACVSSRSSNTRSFPSEWGVAIDLKQPARDPMDQFAELDAVRSEKLTMTYKCESYPAKPVAGRPEPILAGIAVTRDPKRRQESCRESALRLKGSRLQRPSSVASSEGNMCAIARGSARSACQLWRTGAQSEGPEPQQHRSPARPKLPINAQTSRCH
jgi:hypothetical protein